MGGLKSKLRRPKSASRKDKDSSATRQNSKKKKAVNLPDSQSARKIVDPRLPFSNYRQIFSIRNAWKAVSRTMEDCAKETLIRFLNQHPEHRDQFHNIKDITDEDAMRESEDFETLAMDIYQLFDDVINNLETVDKALYEIRTAVSMSFPLNKPMLKEMKGPFVETIKLTLGSDRFTEATEDNFKLLYQFIQDEMNKHLPDVEVISNKGGDTIIDKDEHSVRHDNIMRDADNDGLLVAKQEKEGEINHNFEEEEEVAS